MEKPTLERNEYKFRMDTYQIKAYAKINLGLDVVRRLENGYHEVKMIMQTVDIYDELEFKKAKEGITITTNHGELPTDKNNLIYKAASMMIEEYEIQEGVHIHLTKNIPVAAGMAGGSSDAAATFRGMNELFDLGCNSKRLRELGVKIGADVPYCILGGTALAEGIGEKLTPLKPTPNCYFLIAKPDIDVSTQYVYEQLDTIGINHHPDIDGMVKAIEKGSLQGIIDRMENVLENVTIQKHPIIQQIKDRMLELGAEGSLMSGSGPTVFSVFVDKEKATKAYEQLETENLVKQIFVTTTI